MAKKEERDEMIGWLEKRTTDYDSMQIDINQRAEDGTGTWFLEHERFTSWECGTHGTLFCPGIPGAGKTVLTSIATEHLRRNHKSVAVVYFSHKRTEEQLLVRILLSLTLQLLLRQPAIPAGFYTVYTKVKQLRPSCENAFKLSKNALRIFSRSFFLLDALDELVNKQTRTSLITCLRNLQSSHKHLHIMITARFETEVDLNFPREPSLEIKAVNFDIQRYLVSNMAGLSTCIQRDKSLQNRICQAIMEVTEGM